VSTFQDIGERVLVAQDRGLPAAEAEIVANNWHRPHLVQVAFGCSETTEWIFRSRIAGPVAGGSPAMQRG
jgi:hypothetical protein